MSEELFYIQDNRSFHGNALIWWAQDGGGYTSDIQQAGKYKKEDAVRICRNRKSDVAWPVDYIDNNSKARKIIVDAQHLDYKKRRNFKRTPVTPLD